ncbi:MAG: hypothetical protein DMG55_10620 [Acidobacteria bacterium]|nr:MAG: hypothetical protein DMG55_10620 [Acidobacteriota bacterium]
MLPCPGKGYFDEVSDEAGITVPTRDVPSFGGGFFDYDNDGWLDLFIANGHVYPEIEQVSPETHYKQHTVPQRGRRKIQGDVRADRLEPPGQFLIVPQELSGAPFQFTDHRIRIARQREPYSY